MKNMISKRMWAWLGIGIVLLVGVGVLIDTVGSTAIRSNGSLSDAIALEVVDPLVPGTQTIVRWGNSSELANQQVGVMVRTKGGTQELARAPLFAGEANVPLPCTLSEGPASVEIISVQDQSLIAWTAVTVLEAGPDCAR